MDWDPLHTVQHALWITGGQWAGKTTVCGILAERYGLTHYHYDYHAARGHEDRRQMAQLRRGEPVTGFDAEAHYVTATPAESAALALATFPERFGWVLDDLRALVSPLPVIVDGWGLRPELILPITGAPERILVMVPTDDFRRTQAGRLPRAGALGHPVSDPAKAQRTRIERDRLIAADVVATATRNGIRVLEVDGSSTADEVADVVSVHFAGFLPVPAGVRR